MAQGRPGLERIAEQWAEITASMARKRFFHVIDWYRCYLDALEPSPENVFFVVLYDDGRPEAILPFRRLRRRVLGLWVDFLEFTDHPHVPHGDFIVSNAARVGPHIRYLLEELSRVSALSWDCLLLPRILEDSAAAIALASRTGFLSRKDEAERCNYLVVRPYEETLAGYSKHLRRNIRRLQRRASQRGDISYTSASRSPQLDELFEDLLRVEASGWKGEAGSGTAIALDERLVRFYRLLVQRYSEGERCLIYALRCDDRTIAAGLSLHIDDTLYILKIGFDERYSAIAPGNLLHQYVIESCAEIPTIKFIDLVSDASWHHALHPHHHETLRLLVCTPTLRGRLVWLHDGLRVWLRSTLLAVRRSVLVRKRGKLRLRRFWSS